MFAHEINKKRYFDTRNELFWNSALNFKAMKMS
jgi:hypothetical protein